MALAPGDEGQTPRHTAGASEHMCVAHGVNGRCPTLPLFISGKFTNIGKFPYFGKATWKLLHRGGGGRGRDARRRRGRGLEKWAYVPGPFVCLRMDVGAGTHIFARKSFFYQSFSSHTCVVKMISAMWGSF